MKSLWWIALIATAALQLGVAGWLINRHETTLRDGLQVKLRCAPADPFDPFRGRYVALQFQDETQLSILAEGTDFRGKDVYAHFKIDAQGFAEFTKVNGERPEGERYLKLTHHRGWRLSFPFNRFYMNETLAPAAESAYREAVRRNRPAEGEEDAATESEQTKAWAVLRVRGGAAVIDEVIVEGQPIAEAAKARLARPEDE